MHRLEYAHTMACSSALILAALFNGNASAEVFAPDVFNGAQQYATPIEPVESDNLHAARLQPETDESEHSSSMAQPSSHWISLPVKAQQYAPPASPSPGLRF